MRFSKDFLRSPPKGTTWRTSRGLEVRRFGGSEVSTCELPRNLQRLLRKDSLMIPKQFPGAPRHSLKVPMGFSKDFLRSPQRESHGEPQE
eukprot:12412076-Karenia_brevis.AAC.1